MIPFYGQSVRGWTSEAVAPNLPASPVIRAIPFKLVSGRTDDSFRLRKILVGGVPVFNSLDGVSLHCFDPGCRNLENTIGVVQVHDLKLEVFNANNFARDFSALIYADEAP